jgi:hypothetical protein
MSSAAAVKAVRNRDNDALGCGIRTHRKIEIGHKGWPRTDDRNMTTSRREFVGLLAAAPLVAPVVVKEMAGKVSNMHFEMTAGELFRVAPGESFFPARMGALKRLDGEPLRFSDSRCAYFDYHPFESDVPDYRSAKIPNRLYGAQINQDGEAI